jgi:hypothetical protein
VVRKRRGLAPWSLAREAGIQSATVDGTIEVPQLVQPVLDTGFVDEKGDWKGAKSDDRTFRAFGKEEGIANGGTALFPSVNPDGTWPLDMTGYTGIFIAIMPSNGGDFRIEAVMGPDSNSFANLSPVNAAAVLRGNTNAWNGNSLAEMSQLLLDSADTLVADVWNIFSVQGRLTGQKLLQFKLTNNSGGSSDIEMAFMRVV